MKEKYCKYCGLELENNACSCVDFLRPVKEKVKTSITFVCDTCGKKIDSDSNFCPYCGVPIYVNGNIEMLQRELKGEFAEDVLLVYKKQKEKERGKEKQEKEYDVFSVSKVISVILVVLIIGLLGFKYLYPFIKNKINNYNISKNMETATETESTVIETSKIVEESVIVPTTVVETQQPMIELKDKWIKQDGYFYCFDKNGDPVVDDWVVEEDENGEKKFYYFDIDGKLVINSWIDGEYYVGADGAMLVNTDTPDGASVDENGKVIINENVPKIPVERETYVYYEAPDATSETKAPTTQKSGISGNIKGVDEKKTYELYVYSIFQARDAIIDGANKCNIIYYCPVIAGADENEATTMNEIIVKKIDGEFKEKLKEIAKRYSELPKAITINTIEQRQCTSNRFMFLLHGKITPRHGLTEQLKFRCTYDRKSKQFLIADISNN